ncbi:MULTISPECIES: DUF6049 family protein [unclassified Luteococcus]|uniref:DUF6049 family protein n=1 Tax=unclassified Luteococcus TaxID=2639923 RepID=UPI00313CFFCD
MTAPVARAAAHRALAGALALLLVVLGLGTVVVTPASADEPATLSVSISELSPASGTPDQSVTIRGTVTNNTTTPMSAVQVHLWRSEDPIGDLETLDEVLRSDPANPLGRRMLSFEKGNIFNITDVGDQRSQAFGGKQPKPTFAPGESAEFTVHSTIAELGLAAPGAYLTGVQVRGVPQGQENQTVGRARSLFVLSPPASGKLATLGKPAATVVLLNSRPSMVSAGVFSDDHLAGELRGRLSRLLKLAQTPDVTTLVDPALVDALTAMSKGYQVRSGRTTQPGSAQAQQLAKDHLAALERVVRSGNAYRTLYGSPDVSRAVAADRREVVTQAARPLTEGHPLAALPLAVVPAENRLDEASRELLAGLKPALVLAGNAATQTPVQRLADGSSSRVVAVRDNAYAGGPGPDPDTGQPQVTGRLQATQLLAPQGAVTLVSTTTQADAELAPAPWRTRVALPKLLPRGLGPLFSPADTEQEPITVDPVWLERLDAAEGDLQAWSEITRAAKPEALAQVVLPQALSTAWEGNRKPALRWLDAARSQVGAVLTSDRVSLKVVGSFVTSSQDQEVPVTIRNGLTVPARVRILFTSENPQRIRVADTPVLTVGAGDSETVKVKVTSTANGQVGVQARLATPTGRLIGTPRQMTITATQAGRVGWIIIIASGAVFLAGTAIRIRQVQRERRGSANVAGKSGVEG